MNMYGIISKKNQKNQSVNNIIFEIMLSKQMFNRFQRKIPCLILMYTVILKKYTLQKKK